MGLAVRTEHACGALLVLVSLGAFLYGLAVPHSSANDASASLGGLALLAALLLLGNSTRRHLARLWKQDTVARKKQAEYMEGRFSFMLGDVYSSLESSLRATWEQQDTRLRLMEQRIEQIEVRIALLEQRSS